MPNVPIKVHILNSKTLSKVANMPFLSHKPIEVLAYTRLPVPGMLIFPSEMINQ